MTTSEVTQLRGKFLEKLSRVKSPGELNQLRFAFLGKKGHLKALTLTLANLSPPERKSAGQEINRLKADLDNLLSQKETELETDQRDHNLDLTLPGRPIKLGRLHPTTIVTREMNQFFRYHGYSVAEGPEIETDAYNFEMLNLPKEHPARDLWDTLYVKEPEILLRTHTSSVETRVMTTRKPPIRIVAPGKCFRNETVNATNGAVLHHYEGLAVDQGITLAHLKDILEKFARFLYTDRVKTRFRCKYYPQVEPGAGLDVACTFCRGKGCAVCKYRGWIEILGAGMVHPNALQACGIDPEKYTGFAFGMGLDRITMTKFNIPDIRYLYSGIMAYT